MTVLEIVLLIIGIVLFVLSFLIPEKKAELNEGTQQLTKKQIQEMLEEEMQHARQQVSEVVEETVSYSVEKTERALERLTNDKIQAITEYSGTVLSDIHKNHEETIFLYDMLNSKHENLKETASEVSKTVQQVNEAVTEAKQTKEEAMEVTQALDEAVQSVTENDFVPMDFGNVMHVPLEEAFEVPLSAEADEKQIEKEKTPAQKAQKKRSTTATKTSARKNQVPSNPRGRNKQGGTSDVNLSFDLVKDGTSQNSNDRILELHKAGKSNVAIAKELGLGVGEVKLVIDLFDSASQL